MSGDNPTFYQGILHTTVPELISSHPNVFKDGAYQGLIRPTLEHPHAMRDIETGHFLRGGVARTDVSISMQQQLLWQLFSTNPALVDEFKGSGTIGTEKFLNELLLGDKYDVLRKFPNLLLTLLMHQNSLRTLPPLPPDFHINTPVSDPRTKPFSDSQLQFIQENKLEGGLNVAPNAVAVALIGLAAENQTPVYYSRTPDTSPNGIHIPPTQTIYEYQGEKRRVLKTRHHVLVPGEPSIVFDVSPRTGRVVKRVC